MKFSADSLMQVLMAQTPRLGVRRPLRGEMSWSDWREQLKACVAQSLGTMGERAALEVQELERVQRPGYVRIKLSYLSEPGLRTPAYLLIPDGFRPGGAAVVAIHGHGYGVKDIVGLNADGSERTGDPGYEKDFGVALARRGMMVIAPELFGFGELRMQDDQAGEPGASSCHQLTTTLLMYGRTMAGVRVGQCMRAIDLLAARGEAGMGRVGCMGISGGGLVSTFLAALDDRISAAVVSGYANSFRASIFSIPHCVDNFLPGLALDAEMEDVLSLIALRPMLWESGTRDPIFPIEAARRAADTVRSVYAAQGAEERFEHDVFEADHQISGARSYDFLAEWL